MTVVNLQIVVPEEHIEPASEYGLNEKAYISLIHALGDSGLGSVLDCRVVSAQNS